MTCSACLKRIYQECHKATNQPPSRLKKGHEVTKLLRSAALYWQIGHLAAASVECVPRTNATPTVSGVDLFLCFNHQNLSPYYKRKIIMSMIKNSWSDISAVSISEEAIRALYLPPEDFKVYVNAYEPGKSFPTKAGHVFVLYVLAGSCKTTLEGNEVTLLASEFITLEKGAYTFEVVGNETLKLMKVFSLSN
jgi:quercetin dioxygenase-like cupin family protein